MSLLRDAATRKPSKKLIEVLSASRPDVGFPPQAVLDTWTTADLLGYYAFAGEFDMLEDTSLWEPEDADRRLPGGTAPQSLTAPPHLNVPPDVQERQFRATFESYRKAVKASGIAFRPDGLFPPDDHILAELAADPKAFPFEKHLAGKKSNHERLTRGGWTVGNAAARRGLDLRIFYKEKQGTAKYGTIQGAVRLSEEAAIGTGHWMSAHGGAIESILDESTAELAKFAHAPMIGTIEAIFKLKKAVPLGETMRIECTVQKVQGIRSWVNGSLKDASGNVLATCEATLVDLAAVLSAK